MAGAWLLGLCLGWCVPVTWQVPVTAPVDQAGHCHACPFCHLGLFVGLGNHANFAQVGAAEASGLAVAGALVPLPAAGL